MADNNGYSNHTSHGNHGTHKKQRYNDDDDDEFSSESNSNSNSNSESFISSSSESNNTVYESEAFKNFEYFSDSEEDEDEDEDEYDNTEGGMKSRPYTYAMINGKIRRTPSKSKTFSINGSTTAAKQKAARRNATYYDDSDYDEDRDFNTIFDVSKHGKAEKERKKFRPVSWKTQFIGSLKKNARYLTRNTTRLAVNIAFPLATLWVVWLVTCAILTIKKPMTAYNNPVMDYPEEPLPTFSSAGASELCGRNSTSCGLAVYPRSANSFSFRVLIREALKDPVTGQKPTLQFYDDEAAFIKEMSDFPGRHFGGIAFHCSSTPTNGLCRNYTLHMSADLLPLRSAGDSPVNVFSGAMAASHNASLYISSGLMTLQNAVDSALARMDKLFPRLFNLTVRTKALPVAKVNYVSLPLGLVFAAGGGLSLVPLLCAITGLALFERVYHVRYYLFILGMRRSAYWLALVVTAVALGIVLGVLWVFVCCAAVWTGGGIAAVLTLAGAWVGYLATLLLLVFAVHKVVDTPFWNFFVMITFAAAVPALSSLIPSMTTVQGVLSGFLSPYTFYLIVASVTGSALHGPAPTPFSMLELFAFLVGDFVLYGFVCWFVNESCSGDYGVSRGPLFFLHKSYWRPVRQTTLMEKAQLSKNSLPQRNFEPPLADDFGVRIYGLTKVYDGNTGRKKMGCAVNGLSAPFCKGQVTCILGQDGSGKSTLLSMLCGLIRPTSGEALVDGRSILSDLDAVQKVIGYCPGTDVLYPDLTPEDHIDFISCVRGKKSRLSGSRFGASAGAGTGNNNNGRARNPNAADTTFTTRVLADVGLLESRKSKASSLTPGMRRRLSLAVALIGDPKIVFIDDPSGDGENRIDIASKRIIWTALKRIRGARRTIVFTSRSIEEAEHLGDYVYFMDEGKFKCGGTPEFLEKRFGVGYYLNVIAHTEGKIRKVVKECVPGATFVASTSKSILFKLPFSQTQLYSALFRRLENDGPALGVTKFKLHLNTLGDVFSKICTKVASKNENGDDKEKADVKSAESTGDEKGEKDTENEEEEEEEEEDKLYSRNVTPSVDDYMQSSDGAGIGNESSLLLSKSNLGDSAGLSGQYGGSVTRRDGTGHTAAAAAAPARKQASFFRQLLALLKYKFLFFVRRPVIFVYLILVPLGYLLVSLFVVHGCFHVIDIHGENAKLMYHNISRYEPSYIPFVIGSGSEVVHDDVERFMQIMQSPTLRMAPVENVSVLNRIAYASENNVNMALIFNAFNIDRNMADITVMYNQTDLTSPVAILDFMQSGIYSLLEKRHYDPSGLWVHPVAFSGTYSDTASSGRIHSRLVYGVVGIIMTVFACIRVSTKLAKNATEERVNGFKTQLYTAGLRPAVYVISTISISLIPLVFVYVINEPIFAGFGVVEFAEWETFPIVFLGMLLFFISLSSFNLAFSNGFRTPPNASRALFAILIAITVVPVLLSPLSLIVPQALTSVFKFIFGLVSPPYAFANLLWTILVQDNALPFTSRLLWKKMDNNRRTPRVRGSEEDNEESEEGDDGKAETVFVDKDVEAERGRVMEVEDCIDDVAIVRRLRTEDVHSVSFGVRKGECFGLLGPDNSGKSSVLTAVAGQTPYTRGDVFANGALLRSQERLSLYYRRAGIALCPQHNGFSDYMTGREHLELFARLRSTRARRSEVRDIVQHTLRHIRLTDEADKQVRSYGADAAKKLCVATALLPGAPLVLLDGPTEGASTQARRAIWTFIRRESARLGKTVLLATNSMTEAEELCSTIGVMANGVLQSLGSMKKLKHKFSNKGYVVSVDLEPSSDIPEIERLISGCCRNSKGKAEESVHTIENYSFRHTYVLRNLTSLSALFDSLEKAHLRNGVRNYTVSQASLENVFFYVIREHDEIQEDVNGEVL